MELSAHLPRSDHYVIQSLACKSASSRQLGRPVSKARHQEFSAISTFRLSEESNLISPPSSLGPLGQAPTSLNVHPSSLDSTAFSSPNGRILTVEPNPSVVSDVRPSPPGPRLFRRTIRANSCEIVTMPAIRDTTHHHASPTFSKNPVLERTQSQWLFTPQDLLLSPSILDGMPVTQELANRQKGVNFITQVGIMLKLPQLTLATASVYLHRFFMRHAMVQNNKGGIHHYSVAATAIFLATKVEENYRKMRELVVACCRVAQKQPNLVVDEQSKEYWKWRDTILHNEDLLLEALCFDLQLEPPYRILLDFLRYYDVQENKQLRNTSWAFLNDSLVTTMCLQLTPSSIAGSALYMGVKFAGITLPDDERGRPWWEQLGLDIQDIQKGCNLMAEVYENPALPRQGQKDAYTKDDDMAMFDRTRHTATPQPDRSPAESARSGSQGVKRDRDPAEESGEWGSSLTQRPWREDPLPPSPKRQRRDSRDDNSNVAGPPMQRMPSSSHRDSKEQLDDVQRRIDDIINSSASSRVPPPTLPRRQSTQPSFHGDSSRRHSSSGSNGSGPPPAYSNGHPDRAPPQSRPDSRDNGVYHQHERLESARLSGRVPPGPVEDRPQSRHEGGDNGVYPQNDHDDGARTANRIPPAPVDARPPPLPPPPPETSRNGINDIDDAEKVDYGSEEGEL